ncbi:nucleotidyltransferase family protein [Exilibacterium tricleocarpae]|uniref:Nucleotidyltransferase family protein n=1 Tax=Exilibacterium tricleocarpae TaxID=2591008 RepID=A0A545SMH1_9GAMM|nr:nucleotidyltransferase family protein [Exilibacterium tricleocarpae]TQV66154.1 nucleotidyltransferase family protein [Exilibacterium tricleocarpae]
MIKGILLAAGQARRFGSQKLLARLADGVPVGLKAAAAVAGAVDTLTIVIRAGDGEVKKMYTDAGFTCLDSAAANAGMGASLSAGIDANRDASAWLVALADMPFIRPETTAAVAAALRRGQPIAQPRWQGRAGHPVGFHNTYLEELLALSGDRGAREILRRHRQSIHWVEVDDKGVLMDVDTPADLPAGLL